MTTFQAALFAFSVLYIAVLGWVLTRANRRATPRPDANTPQTPSSTLAEYFVSGRDVGMWTAVATLGATEIGLITIAYNAQKGFNDGFAAFHIGIAAFIGCAIVGMTGLIVRPLRRENVLTIPEYYGKRYGQDVRILGASVMALGGILNMGLFLKVASVFLLALLGIDPGAGWIAPLMIALVVIAVAYTAYGGMRSVIATDVVQFLLMVSAIIGGAAFLTTIIPPSTAATIIAQQKGPSGFDPLVNENFGLTYVIWMIFVAGIVSSAVWPTALSRALCIKQEKDVAPAYLIASVVFMGRMILPAFLGVLAFAYFNGGADVMPDTVRSDLQSSLAKYGTDADLAATPLMLGMALPEILVAFLAVAMFASFMSTQDGYLFCWSSIIARDIAGPLTGRTEDVGFQINATRIGIVAIALYEVYWGLLYAGKEDIWDYLAVSGSIYFCSGVVILVGGLYWKRATRRGALLALAFGFSAIVGLAPVKAALGLDALSSPAIGFGAIALSAAAFIIGSLSETPPPETATQRAATSGA
ncbi:MAG: sodium:solute symporter family protein [Pseudomonadota bacterium]